MDTIENLTEEQLAKMALEKAEAAAALMIAEGTEQASAGQRIATIANKFKLDKGDVPDSSDFKQKFDTWFDSLEDDISADDKAEVWNVVTKSLANYHEAKEDDEDESDDDKSEKGKGGKKDDDSDEEEEDDDEDEDLDESVVVDEESMKKFKAAVGKTEKKLAKAQDKKDDEKAAKFQKQLKEAYAFLEAKGESETVNVQEDIRLLCESEANLTEGFKEKAGIIVEAAIASRLKSERILMQEEFDKNLNEATEKVFSDLSEKVDGYLTYAVESWMNDNKVAIDSGLRTEIAESFITSLKTVFNEHYMEVPAEKADLFESVESERDQLKEALAAKEAEAATLLEEVSAIKRVSILSEESESLADTQKEKLAELCEGVEYVSEAVWRKKVTTIRDTYFKKSGTPVNESTNTNPNATTSTEVIVEGAENYTPVNNFQSEVLDALKRMNGK